MSGGVRGVAIPARISFVGNRMQSIRLKAAGRAMAETRLEYEAPTARVGHSRAAFWALVLSLLVLTIAVSALGQFLLRRPTDRVTFYHIMSFSAVTPLSLFAVILAIVALVRPRGRRVLAVWALLLLCGAWGFIYWSFAYEPFLRR